MKKKKSNHQKKESEMVQQAVKPEKASDTHISTQPQDFNKAQKEADHSKEIKVGSIVYKKPVQMTGNVTPDALDAHPYSVLDIKKDIASVQWMDHNDNLIKSDQIPLKDLMVEQPK